MESTPYQGLAALVEQLVSTRESDRPEADTELSSELESVRSGMAPSEDFLRRLADRLGMRTHDLYLVAGVDIPERDLQFDKGASSLLPQIVNEMLKASASKRRQVREYVQQLAGVRKSIPLDKRRDLKRYPPGPGSLIVQMLDIRNLGWSSTSKVMYLISDIYLSAATYGAIGRGEKNLDPDLLWGFAVVLGIPISTLSSLTGVDAPERRDPTERAADVAELLWGVRHLDSGQLREVFQLIR